MCKNIINKDVVWKLGKLQNFIILNVFSNVYHAQICIKVNKKIEQRL